MSQKTRPLQVFGITYKTRWFWIIFDREDRERIDCLLVLPRKFGLGREPLSTIPLLQSRQ